MFERETQGAVDVIRGSDPLDVDHVEALGKLLEACLNERQPYAVLNLEGTPLIDSAGLELLLDFNEQFRRVGGDLKLAAPNPLCAEILYATRVDENFEVFSDPLAAVGSFVR